MLLDVGERGLSLSQLGVLSQRQWLFVFFNTKMLSKSFRSPTEVIAVCLSSQDLGGGWCLLVPEQNCGTQRQEQEVELSFNLSIIYLSHPLLFRDFLTKTLCLIGSGLAFVYLASFEKNFVTDSQVSCSSCVLWPHIIIKGKPLLAVKLKWEKMLMCLFPVLFNSCSGRQASTALCTMCLKLHSAHKKNY